jgi:hypothetical protein
MTEPNTDTKTDKKTKAKKGGPVIPELKFQEVNILIRGDAPYVSNKFSSRVRGEIRAQQEQGSQAKKGKKREPKDFNRMYLESMHKSTDGKYGVAAGCFRNAMVSACRLVGFKMTLAKLSVFVEADALDEDDATPLVLFSKGDPHYAEHTTRNATGVMDIRPRGMWDPGWEMKVKVRYDADIFSQPDIINLFVRVGKQVGIGAGRPDSKDSCGMGWGTFDVVQVS